MIFILNEFVTILVMGYSDELMETKRHNPNGHALELPSSHAHLLNSGGHFNIKTSSYQNKNYHFQDKIDGLVQERRNSIANALELHLSCTDPSRWSQYRLIFIMGIPIPGKMMFISMVSCQKGPTRHAYA